MGGKWGEEAAEGEAWKGVVLRLQEVCSRLEAKEPWRRGIDDWMAEGLEEEGGEETPGELGLGQKEGLGFL